MQTISWFALAWCLVPIVLVGFIFYQWKSSISELAIASTRMLIQLIAVGYFLLIIFEQPSLLVSLGIMAVMFSAATFIAVRPVKQYSGILTAAGIALFISVSFHLLLSIKFVLNIDPWYSPRILIPLAGMYFANTMTTLSLTAERFYAELANNKPKDEAKKTAFQAAMIPQINGLLAVGLVALPGMMTGQILSGVSPLIAVRYQIMIMTMLLGACGLGSYLLLKQLEKKA